MDPPASKPEPPQPDDPLPDAATRVAVAQICRSVGYAAARPSALSALSDVAGRHIRALARSAASAANLRCRTEANLLDVARAAEELALGRGFPRASDPAAPLLGSEVLKELVRFVGAVEEEPFARQLPTREGDGGKGRGGKSFAEAGREPPAPHVPRWLPCFPDEWCKKEAESEEVERGAAAEDGGGGERGRGEGGVVAAAEERGRVRFRLGDNNKNKNKRNNRSCWKKRRVAGLWEEDGNLAVER